MGEISKEIRISYIDAELSTILSSIPANGNGENFSRCFDYSEEFFIKLESFIDVPHFQIHHDVRNGIPEESYMKSLRKLISPIARLAPFLFSGLTYIFNPSDIFRPRFYKLYRMEDSYYLYLFQFDLMLRPQYGEIVERGTNDIAPAYRTNRLFVDANFIPLNNVRMSGGRIESFEILQTISETWIGETGRRYYIQGIWMDSALTSFFTRLFLPEGKSVYPFFPFLCKYKTVCGNVITFSPGQREEELPYLHKAIRFLEPRMRDIEAELRNHDFSPDLDIFINMKKQVPDFFNNFKKEINVVPYLNEHNMKEYSIAAQI